MVYVAENPPLVGLGPTAVRDTVSHLKYEGAEALGVSADALERAIGFGISQSGRFLRTFLYYGFNEDERGRIAFDGVISHVAGGGRGSFNHRFAQPSRDAHPFMNFLYPTDIFPFTDRAQRDPETGRRDGILTHRLAREFWPKIFYTNSSYEYWGRAASLIHTHIDGTRDSALFDKVRIFLFAGTQHGPSRFPPGITLGQQLANPLDFRWSMRALLQALQRWTAGDGEPPSSRYPRLDAGTLVAADQLGFPQIPDVRTSSRVHEAYRVDYGPLFVDKGVVTQEPPVVGKAFPILVPSVRGQASGEQGQLRDLLGRQLGEVEVAGPIAAEPMSAIDCPAAPSGELARGIQHADPRYLVGHEDAIAIVDPDLHGVVEVAPLGDVGSVAIEDLETIVLPVPTMTRSRPSTQTQCGVVNSPAPAPRPPQVSRNPPSFAKRCTAELPYPSET